MALELNKLFTFVPSNKTASFKENHVNGNSSDAYYGKICFLAGTGEIMTRGQVFAVNQDSDITALQTLVGSTLDGTGAQSATTVIGFIQEVYTIASTNATAIGNSSSGLIKDVADLETRVGADDTTGLSARIKANEDALTLLNKTDGTVGSVKKTVDDAIAAIVASAPDAFDTLKEIADWIQADSQNNTGFDAANRITTLETKVGNSGTPAVLYTAEEATAYNTEHNLTSEDEGYVSEGDVKTAAVNGTGIFHELDLIRGELDAMSGGAGSIQTQIETNINSLDSQLILAGTTASQPSTIARNTSIDVLGSVTISESNGVLDPIATGKSAKVVLQADAAGAAQKAYEDLLGASTDASDGTVMTLHGVKNYAANLVSSKNVSASGDNSLIDASATNNAVSVSATQDLIDAVSHANTAIQSVTLTSGNTTYLTVTNTTGSGAGTAASAQYSPVIGAAPTINGLTATKGTNGLATTDQLADAINALDFWEEYSSEPAAEP